MSEDGLAEGWVTARLGDGLALDVQPGFACGGHSRDTQDVPHLRPMNVSEEGRIDLGNLKFVPKGEVDREARLLRSGDVLFNNTNSPELVGKTACYQFPEPRAFSNHMTRVRCHADALDSRYCALVLHARWMDGYFESICNNHVSQASISRAVLLQTLIPLPPLAEQQRIVAKVEALLARVNAARQRLAKVPAILKRFRQSVLAAACSGRLTADWREGKYSDDSDVPEGWKKAPVSRVVAVQNGRAFPSKQYDSTGVRLLRPGNLHVSGEVSWTEKNTKCLPAEWAEKFPDYLLKPGDLLMNLTAQSLKDEFLGRVCLNRDDRLALLNQRICRFIPKASDVRPYLFIYFKSPLFRRYVDTLDTGSLIRHMHSKQVVSHEVPLPPIPEQHEIVRRVEALFRLADAIEKRVAAATARAGKLTQAILAKAFRGELVPTEAELARREGRDYEPASVLLERIRKERPTVAKPKSGRKQKQHTGDLLA